MRLDETKSLAGYSGTALPSYSFDLFVYQRVYDSSVLFKAAYTGLRHIWRVVNFQLSSFGAALIVCS